MHHNKFKTFFCFEAPDVDEFQLKIIGPKKNCDGAETRIKQCIVRLIFFRLY